jgi:hypothetical protein
VGTHGSNTFSGSPLKKSGEAKPALDLFFPHYRVCALEGGQSSECRPFHFSGSLQKLSQQESEFELWAGDRMGLSFLGFFA